MFFSTTPNGEVSYEKLYIFVFLNYIRLCRYDEVLSLDEQCSQYDFPKSFDTKAGLHIDVLFLKST